MKVEAGLRAKHVRTSGRHMERARRPRTPKPEIFYVISMCRGGGCATKVLDLTRGRPVGTDHMITTILMIQTKAEVEVKYPGVTDEPVVVVKGIAADLHGDMRGGENGSQARRESALERKTDVEAKGGTQRKADSQTDAQAGGLEKVGAIRTNLQRLKRGTYPAFESHCRRTAEPERHGRTARNEGVRWNS